MRWCSIALLMLSLLAMLFAGCTESTESDSDSATTKNQSRSDDADSDSSAADSNDQSRSNVKKRETIDGRWTLMLSVNIPDQQGGQQRMTVPVALLEIRQDKDAEQRTAEILDVGQQVAPFASADITNSELTDESLDVTLEANDKTYRITGRLRDGAIRGEGFGDLLESAEVFPAWFEPTDDKTIAGRIPQPDDGPAKIQELLTGDDFEAATKSYLEKYPDTPFALDLFPNLIFTAKDAGLTEKQIRQLAEEYHQAAALWGPLTLKSAKINTAYSLVLSGHLPHIAAEILRDLEKELTDSDDLFTQSRKEMVEMIRNQAEQLATFAILDSEEASVRAAGAEEAREKLKEDPYSVVLLYGMAEYERQHGDVDEAIRYLALLDVVPMMNRMLAEELSSLVTELTPPADTLRTLWKQKHGNTDGLSEYLDEVYTSTIQSVVKEKVPPRTAENGQTVLVELFTGSECPPCVAADLATIGVEKSFDPSEVIVLRYHQHIPAPDPLANTDSLARGRYYLVQGTPHIRINGESPGNVGGFVEHAGGVYETLREMINTEREQSTEIELNLSAEVKEGQLSLSAQAGGFDESQRGLRMFLVLAEEQIDYAAGNGIRRHEMIVRDMPGGVGGVAMQNGELKYENELNFGEIRQEISDYLAAFQESSRVRFQQIPLDFAKLHFVAIVQDGDSKEVLQVTRVPVQGLTEVNEDGDSADATTEATSDPQPPESEAESESDKPEPADQPDGPVLAPPQVD